MTSYSFLLPLARDQRWRAVVENASDLISEVGSDGTIRFASLNHQALLGYAPWEVVGRPAVSFLHPDDIAQVQVAVQGLRAPGDQVALEARVLHADGSWHWAATTVRLIAEDGQNRSWLAVSCDITERKRLQEERALLSLLSDVVGREDDLGAVTRALSEALKPLIPFDLLFVSLLTEKGIELAASDLPPGDQTPIYFDVQQEKGLGSQPNIWHSLQHLDVVCDNHFPGHTPERRAWAQGLLPHEQSQVHRSNLHTLAYINVPLRVDGEAVGMLHLDSFRAGVFTPEHEAMAVVVGAHIAGALHRLQSLGAARQAQKRLSEIVSQVDAVVWEADPVAQAFTFVSPQVSEWIGCAPEAWIGPFSAGFANWVHPEDRDDVLRRCAQLTAQGLDHTLEFRLLRGAPLPPAQGVQVLGQVLGQAPAPGNGATEPEAYLWVRDIVSVEVDESGAPTRMHGLMLDITERKRANLLLHENEEKFRAVFENALDAILIFDSDARFVSVNSAAAELLGIPADEVSGRALEEFVAPEVREQLRSDWHKYLRLGTARGEFNMLRADGRTLELEFSWRSFFLPGRHLVVARDVSSRNNISARLMLLERAVESVATGVLMMDARLPGNSIFYVNEAWERITGRTQAQALGQHFPNWNSFEGGAELDTLRQAIARKEQCRVTLRQVRPDGRAIWVEVSVAPVRDASGAVTHFIAVKSDISERHEAEERLRESNAISQATQEAAADGICLIDKSGSLVSCNQKFAQMWQIPPGLLEDLIAQGQLMYHILSLMQEPDEFLERVSSLMDDPQASTRDEIALRDGRVFERYSAPAISPEGKNYGRVWSFSDITERKRTEQQLRHQAFHDSLTGLPNRAFFMDTLGRVLARARRSGETSAVLFLDLDRFKIINDSLGHETGDQLLVEASRRLKSCLRPGDLSARFGGDEFTVLLQSIESLSDATRVAERIAEVLSLPFDLGGHEVYTTTSVGIVLSCSGADRAEDLLRDADVAMYRAKNKGRARYEIFDSEMSAAAFERLRMEIDLRQGIKHGHITLYYQPLIDLRSGRVIGVEALARWKHPERGLILPGEFIELAEESGMIFLLGAWVLRQACAQTREWSRKYFEGQPFYVSVNISAKQFHGPSLSDEVARALQESGLEPSRLNLEITESVMLGGGGAASIAALVAQGLTSLRSLGVRLSLDDFGTGFSSLSYLKKFPLDTLKIDRSFISRSEEESEEGRQNAAIVDAVQGLGRALKMTVVAEGIETAPQLERLRSIGCDVGQGYFFSRPICAEEFEEMLRRAPTW